MYEGCSVFSCAVFYSGIDLWKIRFQNSYYNCILMHVFSIASVRRNSDSKNV